MYEDKTIQVPVKECKQGTTVHCEDYEVPKQEVVRPMMYRCTDYVLYLLDIFINLENHPREWDSDNCCGELRHSGGGETVLYQRPH